MNLDELWNSTSNRPTSTERDAVVQSARATIRAARWREAAFLGWTVLALSAATLGAVYVGVTRATSGGWPLLLMLVAQWAAFAYLLRRAVLSRRRTLGANASLSESLQALWRQVDSQRRGYLAVLTLFAVALPLLLMAIWQLQVSGKMVGNEAWSASALLGGTTVLSGAGVFARLRRANGRRRQMEALVAQYRDT